MPRWRRFSSGKDKNSEARALLEKAVTLNSQDWQSQYELAVLLNQAGETARATDLLAEGPASQSGLPGGARAIGHGAFAPG